MNRCSCFDGVFFDDAGDDLFDVIGGDFFDEIDDVFDEVGEDVFDDVDVFEGGAFFVMTGNFFETADT